MITVNVHGDKLLHLKMFSGILFIDQESFQNYNHCVGMVTMYMEKNLTVSSLSKSLSQTHRSLLEAIHVQITLCKPVTMKESTVLVLFCNEIKLQKHCTFWFSVNMFCSELAWWCKSLDNLQKKKCDYNF